MVDAGQHIRKSSAFLDRIAQELEGDLPKVIGTADGRRFLHFINSYQAELFLKSLGVDPETVDLLNIEGPRTSLLLPQSIKDVPPHLR